MSRSERRRHWQGIVAEQGRSGLGVAEFCRRHHVPPASFYQWRKKLGEAKPTEGALAARRTFVPLSLASAAGVRVELPGGAVVCLPAGDERSLAQVISLLLAQGGEAMSAGEPRG